MRVVVLSRTLRSSLSVDQVSVCWKSVKYEHDSYEHGDVAQFEKSAAQEHRATALLALRLTTLRKIQGQAHAARYKPS